jgi:hypothetical protein
MESILPEITKWLVYALIGWAVLTYVIATFHTMPMNDDSDARSVTAVSAYTCATLLMAAAIHLLFGT